MAQLLKVDIKAKAKTKLISDFDKVLPELKIYMDTIIPVYQVISIEKQQELRQHNYILDVILTLAGVV